MSQMRPVEHSFSLGWGCKQETNSTFIKSNTDILPGGKVRSGKSL